MFLGLDWTTRCGYLESRSGQTKQLLSGSRERKTIGLFLFDRRSRWFDYFSSKVLLGKTLNCSRWWGYSARFLQFCGKWYALSPSFPGPVWPWRVTSDKAPAMDHIDSLKGTSELLNHARQAVYVWGIDRQVENISPTWQPLYLDPVPDPTCWIRLFLNSSGDTNCVCWLTTLARARFGVFWKRSFFLSQVLPMHTSTHDYFFLNSLQRPFIQ